jgi:hypothetical protein
MKEVAPLIFLSEALLALLSEKLSFGKVEFYICSVF